MIIYFCLVCSLYFSFLSSMEIEKDSIFSLSPGNNYTIENHYEGKVINLAEIYKDIPLLISAAPTNKKALLSLIGYQGTIRYFFDFFAYQTPQTHSLVTTIPWHQFPLEDLQQQEPTTPDEKFYYGVLYYCLALKKVRKKVKNSKTFGLSLLSESANAGFYKAMHYLGCINRLNKNKLDAISWHTKAQALGYIPSMFEMAFMKLKKEKDEHRAAEFISIIKEAATGRYSTAHYYLGLMYDSKFDFTSSTNRDKARHHYKAAAQLGCLQARHNLGIMYLHSTEKDYDVITGLHQINKAAQREYAPSQAYLGMLYCSGILINRDVDRGLKLLTQASQQNNSNAQYHLAMIFLLGEIVQQDISQGIQLLKKSADAQNIQAQYQLGILYLNNIHVPQDTKKAVDLLSQSASKGYHKAQYVLGKLYIEGTIIEKKFSRGKKLLQSSSAQNYQKAIEYIKNNNLH